MAGIQVSGLASGLDTASIINQLMSLEKAPRTQLTDRQLKAQARHDAFADIQGKLNALKSAATALKSEATWGDTQAVSTSDANIATVRRTAGAASGGYDLEVTRLASADQHTYAFAPSASASTLTVNGKSVALAANATVDDAVAAVNGSDDVGVFAVAVSGKLVLSARQTGVANQFTATGSQLTEDLTAARAGQDASFKIDGVAKTSSSNVIANALPGVELTLKAKTSTSPVAITVGDPGPDLDGVASRVKTFVTAYNATVDAIRSRTTEKRVADASTAADKKAGVLFGDSGLTGILSSLRSTLAGVANLGITTGDSSGSVNADAVAGKITLDSTKLKEALAASPTTVKTALSAFDDRVEGILTPLTQSGGIFDARVSSTDAQLRDVADALTRFDDRMTQREALLNKQFTALESVLNKNQGLQSTLAGMLR